MVRVAGRFHEVREEEAAFLSLSVAAEAGVALFHQTSLTIGEVIDTIGVSHFFFAFAKETAVLGALATPAVAGGSVEDTDAAAWDHDVELALVHI